MSDTDGTHEVLRAVPVHEAVAVAMTYHRNGHLAAAGEIYQQVLEIAPDHPDGLHYAGVLAHQQLREGRIDHRRTRGDLRVEQVGQHLGVGGWRRPGRVDAAAAEHEGG